MNIGDKFRMYFNPQASVDAGRGLPVTAEVVYINWEHRYFCAEFDVFGHTLRECFKFEVGNE